MRNFRDLDIWHLAMEIVELVYKLLPRLPDHEKFGLRVQMGKAVISMPSNISEGCSRNSNKELARFIEYSFELETQLLAATKIGYYDIEDTKELITKLHKFQKMTNSFRSKILTY